MQIDMHTHMYTHHIHMVVDTSSSAQASGDSSAMEVEAESGSLSNGVKSSEPSEQDTSDGDKLSEEEIKLWSAVKENPSDFSSWTSLLHLVEQKVWETPRQDCNIHIRVFVSHPSY